MNIPKPLARLIDSFQKLPGIGPKTAQRLAFYLLHVPQSEISEFANSLENLKREIVLCSLCKNATKENPCVICSDKGRDHSQVMVVEQPLDVLAFERIGKYKGVYHVLHGSIDPLNNIGPDEIFIADLLQRITDSNSHILEVIIATNPTMEGDATAMYLSKKIKDQNSRLKITRLGMGIPTGADLEYADEMTLKEALEGRRII